MAVASAVATWLTGLSVPTSRTTSPAPAANPGSRNPGGFWAASGSIEPGVSPMAIAISSDDAGQAIALTISPRCEPPTEVCRRFALSPQMLIVNPAAISTHGVLRWPVISALPPTTSSSSSTSPIGYAAVTAVDRTDSCVVCTSAENTNAAQTAAAPNPATAPSSQLGEARRRVSPRTSSSTAA